ncbi:GMC family oxidoreductase [Endozoicomonas sp. SM1973]|uniref:GMC family oxidoreductase n=1 Tax=Spartinivicinus marinus TaxID=2994442 RepID=A0A853I4E0_9GAMM|nr:GMC family oxidoreductase [Spartinivicinus marinus]MCX4029925.1 GMC family oxidoreductase [Spartinivicinus marinus]NYZ64831.1 GMC family oxidoreductase [Spartinivicinus marinus]
MKKAGLSEKHYDLIVIGSGMGGATLLNQLADTGLNILLIERGTPLIHSTQARDSQAIFVEEVYRPNEQWLDGAGKPFNPGNYYNVGGNSKFYGGVMLRFRQEDFGELVFDEGISPAWPFAYETLAPYYQQAEALYQVKGVTGQDSCEPPGVKGYVGAAIPDEPTIAKLRSQLEHVGAKPFSLPLAIDIDAWLALGQTPWDAFPGTNPGKLDAESAALQSILDHPNISLLTNTTVTRLHTEANGKQIKSVEVCQGGVHKHFSARLFVLAAGAVNSAAILLRSADQQFPEGLANRSGQVGRNFMNHNCTALMAVNPLETNHSVYQKTLGINDFYLSDGNGSQPLGNIQLLGKIDGTMLKAQLPRMPKAALDWLARHSVDWYVMSEDLPQSNSQVRVSSNGQIILDWQQSNLSAHQQLVKKTKQLMRAVGFPIVLTKAFDRRTPSHQCGTVRMGNDPATAPLDPYCRAYDHDNLFVVDASFFPSSAAVNPALTIAAQAIRVAEHIKLTEIH